MNKIMNAWSFQEKYHQKIQRKLSKKLRFSVPKYESSQNTGCKSKKKPYITLPIIAGPYLDTIQKTSMYQYPYPYSYFWHTNETEYPDICFGSLRGLQEAHRKPQF